MTERTHVDAFLRGKIINLLEWGRTQMEISEELGIAPSVLSRLWKRFQDGGNNRSGCSNKNHDRQNLSRHQSEAYVCRLRDATSAEFVFMEDNTRPHRTNIVNECLQYEGITRKEWPAFSPDLNPIEHVRDMLGRRIADREPPSTCVLELWRVLFTWVE
ncbi:uncharacterized protein TNCV_4655101 [Trichonephila clavipes]|nr:uncharacterized protein TNCV_4655101 [Trichonephila clavipes]